MPEKKKQHYVPRFYLRNFSWASRKAINIFNIQGARNIISGNLANRCYEPYFYGDNLVIENAFCDFEGLVARFILDIISTNRAPKRFSEEHHSLLLFVLLQYSRTKYAAEAHDELVDKLVKNFMIQDGRFSEEYLRDVKITSKNPTAVPLKVAAESVPMALDLMMKVLLNRTDTNFVSSDNPVVLYNQYCEKLSIGSNTGLASQGLQIIYPLSPRHALLFYDSVIYKVGEKKNTFTLVVDGKDIEQFNDLQWLNALQNIYYDNAQKPAEIMRGYTNNHPKRHTEKTLWNEYEGTENKSAKADTLIHIHKHDHKIGLRVRCIKQKKVLLGDQQYSGGKLVRDKVLIDLHRKFMELVKEKIYRK